MIVCLPDFRAFHLRLPQMSWAYPEMFNSIIPTIAQNCWSDSTSSTHFTRSTDGVCKNQRKQ